MKRNIIWLLLIVNIIGMYGCNPNKTINTAPFSGYLEVANLQGKVIQKGKYSSGFKVGVWEYLFHDSTWNSIEWEVVGDSIARINMPKGWEATAKSSSLFNMKANTLNSNSQITLFQKSTDGVLNPIKSYREQMLKGFNERYIILQESQKNFRLSDQEFLLSKYSLKQTEDVIYCMNALIVKGGSIFELTYYFKDQNIEVHRNLFADILFSVEYRNEFIFTHDEDDFQPQLFFSS